MFYVVLKGVKEAPMLLEKNRVATPDPLQTSELMDWYESEFLRIIDRFKLQRISYRLNLFCNKKKYILSSVMPLGILNLVANKENISVDYYTPQSYVPSKLGLSKHVDLYELCDKVFGDNPPYWNKNMKDALLAAWFSI